MKRERKLNMELKNLISRYLAFSIFTIGFVFTDSSREKVIRDNNGMILDGQIEQTVSQPTFMDNFRDGEHPAQNNNITSFNTTNNNAEYVDIISLSRDGGTTYQFTNCGQSGRYGPSQSQANSAYSGTNLEGTVTVASGIQTWTVPSTGIYRIEAIGAAGGTQLYSSDYHGGEGASMSGDFSLTQGDILKIIVGQKGENTRATNQDNAAPGGGGGSFIWISGTNNLLIAAGGGGGGGRNNSTRIHANITTSGDGGNQLSNGGTNGNGGRSNHGGWSYWAGGGAGWLTNGTAGNNSTNYNASTVGYGSAGGGLRPLQGGTGGIRYNDGHDEGGDGGFGGGGGGGSDNMGAGGGGGYSGGGGDRGSYGNQAGGGAGSYNSGNNQINSENVSTGNGWVNIISSSAPSNTAPTVTAQSVTGNEDTAQTIVLAGNDIDGDALTYTLATNPTNGTATLNGANVSYTPNANYHGNDSFTFKVSDGELTSESATVNITIIPVNDAPIATAQSASSNEDLAKTITLAGSDVEGNALTYVLASSPQYGTASLNSGSAPVTHSTSNFLDPSGINVQLSLSSTRWEGSSAWMNNGIYVGPHVAVQPTGLSTPDGDNYFIRNNYGQSSSKYAVTKANNNIIRSSDRGDIVFTIDWAANTTLGARFVAIVDGTWYASGQFGMADDDHGGMNQSQVTDWEVDVSVNVDSDNWYVSLAGAPNGYDWRDGVQWNANPVSGGGLPAGDITQYGIAWLHTGNGDYGAVDNFRVINNGGGTGAEVTYTPNANYHGTDSFTFTASDGELTSEPATVNITIAPVNDPPTITSQHVIEINQGVNYSYTIQTHDIDGDVVTVSSTSPSWLTINNNTLSGVPGSDDVGLHDVTLTANDGNGGTSTQTFSITANATKITISGETGFRMISSPVSGKIYGDLLEELYTQGMPGSDNPDADPNIWTWNDNSWQVVPNLDTTTYYAGTGILVYAFADANFDGIEDDFPLDLSIDSAQVSNDIDIPIATGEWKLVGNPYGVAMDIPNMTERNKNEHNVRPAIHVYDAQEKKYKAHNGTIGEGILATGRLAPFRAFWVHSPPQSRFRFKRSDRRRFGSGNGRTTADSTGSALIVFNTADRSSSAHMSFNLYGEVERDAADALRLMSHSRDNHLISMFYMNDEALAINNLPYDFNADIALDLDVMMLAGTDEGFETIPEDITVSWNFSELPPGISMMLMDNITHEVINMHENNSYSLILEPKGGFVNNINMISAYPSVGESRFTIFMSSATAGQDSEEPELQVETFSLKPAYPNPFNPSTTIRYSIPETGSILIKVYDLSGREVSTLVDRVMPPGYHSLSWNPDYRSSAGIYIIQLISGKEVLNQKVTYLK
tara:strand:- start:6624 stop:10700 length:4077 start_codon:yes stop_codon:yes gene_type:complete